MSTSSKKLIFVEEPGLESPTREKFKFRSDDRVIVLYFSEKLSN